MGKKIDKLKTLTGGAAIGAVVMSGFWIANHVPADRVASSPDRIIPAARNMAKDALNPDKLVMSVCDALPDQEGNEFMLTYDGEKNLVSTRKDGETTTYIIEPYEGDSWRCN